MHLGLLSSRNSNDGKLSGDLSNKGLVNVWDNSSSSDGSLDEGVELLISTDSKL